MQAFTRNIVVKSLGAYLNLLSHLAPQKGFSLAYAFFSRPRKGRLNPESLPEILQRATQQQHYYGPYHFHTYTWAGNGPSILLVHGWESNANRWSRLLEQLLPTGKNIIAIDGPAHGLSDGVEFNVPLYAEFINVACRRFMPDYIIGHSIGGTASVYYQYLYPDHSVKKLVLLGAPCDFSVILQNYINILNLNSKIHKYILEYTKTRFKIAVEDFTATVFLRDCAIPGLLIHDRDDDAVRYTEAEKLAAAWKTARLITTQGLGHSLHDKAMYQQIIHFLEL